MLDRDVALYILLSMQGGQYLDVAGNVILGRGDMKPQLVQDAIDALIVAREQDPEFLKNVHGDLRSIKTNADPGAGLTTTCRA